MFSYQVLINTKDNFTLDFSIHNCCWGIQQFQENQMIFLY